MAFIKLSSFFVFVFLFGEYFMSVLIVFLGVINCGVVVCFMRGISLYFM